MIGREASKGGETILATAENIAHALAHTHGRRHRALPPCCSEWFLLVSLKAFVSPQDQFLFTDHTAYLVSQPIIPF